MYSTYVTSLLLSALAAAAQESTKPGYNCHPHCIASTIPNDKQFDFGQHYAVLNLDLINAIVGGVAETAAGKAFISNTADWIDAVHSQDPVPLQIFTRIYFSNSHKPEVGQDAPFYNVGGALGTAASPETELYPAFTVNKKAGDVVLQKTRYYAGAGNALEQILSTQNIDTVILSGIRSSGVIISTAYRLFDLDYKV
jgi:nicotinamidase-related amidase